MDMTHFILQVFTQEFQKRFKKDPKNNARLAISLSRDVSEEDNLKLIREATMEETWQAAKQIGPLKGPNPDELRVVSIRSVGILLVSLFLI